MFGRMTKSCIITGLAAIMMLSFAGCGSTNSAGSQGVNAAQVGSKKLTADEFQQMYTNPSKFKGASVDFYAKIFTNVMKDDKGTYFQAYSDPDQYSKNTLIRFSDPNLNVKQGDIVHVTGVVSDNFNGQNGFGASISAPIITAAAVEKTDYITAFSPALKTITVNSEQNHNGFIIKLEKVELAAKETRVYVSVTNKMSTNKISFYTFNTKIVQGSTQLQEQSNFEANYPSMQNELLPGVTETGMMAFTPADVKGGSMKIVFEGSCDDYNVTIDPFTFDVSMSA